MEIWCSSVRNYKTSSKGKNRKSFIKIIKKFDDRCHHHQYDLKKKKKENVKGNTVCPCPCLDNMCK